MTWNVKILGGAIPSKELSFFEGLAKTRAVEGKEPSRAALSASSVKVCVTGSSAHLPRSPWVACRPSRPGSGGRAGGELWHLLLPRHSSSVQLFPRKKVGPMSGRASDFSREPGNWNIYENNTGFQMLANNTLKYVKFCKGNSRDQSLFPEPTFSLAACLKGHR